MIIKQDWKHRNNDTSNLTVAQLIEETIREEIDINILRNMDNQRTQYEIVEEGYLQGITILQELL